MLTKHVEQAIGIDEQSKRVRRRL